MASCVFCQILRGDAAASFVMRDDVCAAFLDLHPVNEGHVLVVPLTHAERFSDVPPETAAGMMRMGQAALRALRASGIPCEGANLFVSDGSVAGQDVPHVHLHVAPRFDGDGHRPGFFGADPDAADRARLDATASRLRAALKA